MTRPARYLDPAHRWTECETCGRHAYELPEGVDPDAHFIRHADGRTYCPECTPEGRVLAGFCQCFDARTGEFWDRCERCQLIDHLTRGHTP